MIEPLLPVSGAKGHPSVDDRRVINGMLYKAKTGVAWRDLPERYGRGNGLQPVLAVVAQRHFGHARREGRCRRRGRGRTRSEVSVDSMIVRAHQHSAGGPARVVHTGRQRIRRRAQRAS
jgi:transposase